MIMDDNGSFHSHRGTPSSLDGLVQGRSRSTKRMMTRGTSMTMETPNGL